MCKHFLDAIEGNKYGWFWVCPGGGDTCMYRHALPPGFVLRKDKKKEEREEEKISLEELIENEVRKDGGKIFYFLVRIYKDSEKRNGRGGEANLSGLLAAIPRKKCFRVLLFHFIEQKCHVLTFIKHPLFHLEEFS